jgi:hypothetical protein
MDNATVSSLYCIALYDNYIALNARYPAGGGYIVYIRLSVSASLTAYAIPP